MSPTTKMDTQPLLKPEYDAKTSEPMISSFGHNTVAALGALRAAAGLAAMVSPVLVGKLFFIPMAHPQSAWILRLFGVRDLVAGELTFFTGRSSKPDELRPIAQVEAEKRHLRNVLVANVAIDSLDLVCTSAALFQGTVTRAGFAGVGGGAAAFLLMGLLGLKAIQ